MVKESLYEMFAIVQTGFGSLFMYVGYDAHSFILESVMHSVNEREPWRIDEYAGYYGLAVTQVFYAFACLFAPVLITYAHPKWSLFLGSIGFTLYNAGFLYLNSIYFYCSALVMGFGLAIYNCGQGCYISQHSTKTTLARNASMAWGVTSMSFAMGSIILVITLGIGKLRSGETHQSYSDSEIRAVFGGFTACALLSNIIFGFLPKKNVKNSFSDTVPQQKQNHKFSKRVLSTFKTFGNPNVRWLCLSWFHLGINTSELLGVYPTALIFTESLQGSIWTIAMYSISISCGELATSCLIALLARKWKSVGCAPAYIMGAVASCTLNVLIVLSTPRYSTLYPNDGKPLILETSFHLAVLIGFLFGITDCCWNTARTCIIPLTMPDQKAEGFSIAKFFQSTGAFVLYFLSTLIDVYGHFIISIVFNIAAAIAFVKTSRRYYSMVRQTKKYGNNIIAPSDEGINARMPGKL